MENKQGYMLNEKVPPTSLRRLVMASRNKPARKNTVGLIAPAHTCRSCAGFVLCTSEFQINNAECIDSKKINQEIWRKYFLITALCHYFTYGSSNRIHYGPRKRT